VDDSRNVTKDGQQDVDEEVSAATTLKEDTKRWKDDGDDDLDNVARQCISRDRRLMVDIVCTHDPVKGMFAVLLVLFCFGETECVLKGSERRLVTVMLVVDCFGRSEKRRDEQDLSTNAIGAG